MVLSRRSTLKMLVAAVIVSGNCFVCGLSAPAALAAPQPVDAMPADCADQPQTDGAATPTITISSPAAMPHAHCPMDGELVFSRLNNSGEAAVSTILVPDTAAAPDLHGWYRIALGQSIEYSGTAPPPTDLATYLTGTIVKNE